MKFQGAYTALVTPFTKENTINESTLREFIQFQIQNGISGIVPCGTTGESPTLSDAEKKRVIQIAIEEAKDKVHVIAGTGNYNTIQTSEATAEACKMGIDGALVITPYYNKPTQEGLFQHFKYVADHNPEIDIVVYNVPSRTNVNILPETMERLVESCKNITTIKDATGDISQILDLRSRCGDRLTILSGEDGLIWPYIAAGADGVISVVSNVKPKETVELARASLNNENNLALSKQLELNKLINVLFAETNPIPVKYMVREMGYDVGSLRLPLHELSEQYREKIKSFV